MKKAKFITLIIFPLLLLSCLSNNEGLNKRPKYDIEILYRKTDRTSIIPNKSFNKKYLNDGKLYLHFESNFKNDTVTVNVNGKFYKNLILNTDHGLGYSDIIKFEDIRKINNVSLSVNSGNEAFFEINHINHITINYMDSILTIRYLENVPYYD